MASKETVRRASRIASGEYKPEGFRDAKCGGFIVGREQDSAVCLAKAMITGLSF